VGLFVWSGLTALSGLAQSLGQLVVVRLGVGAAEGAGSAPAHSLLCDYFPLDRRARVMTIFGVGGMVGIMAGYVVGGLVAEHYGWRSAFFVLGLPGIFLGLLILLSVREPERGRLDGVISAENIPTRQVIRQLLGTRSYVHMVLGASYHAFAGMGWGPFLISYLIRSHDLSLGRASISLVFLNQGIAMLAALLAAWMCDRLGRSDIRWYMWIPTWGALLALPFSLAFVLWPAGGTFPLGPWMLPVAFLPLMASSFLGATWNGPTLAMTQSVTPASMRSRASALTTGTYNLIGMGLGPLLVGFISDLLAPRYGVESLRYGLLVVGLAHVLGAVHHWRAARYLRADLDAVSRAA
jgi:MFS family permease